MNNFSQRLLFGSLYVIVLVGSILYGKFTFIAIFWLMMNISLYEFNRLVKFQSVFPFILGNLLFIFANVLNISDIPSKTLSTYAGIALFLSFFATFISVLFSKKEEAVEHLGKKFLSVVYVAVPYTLIVMIPFINAPYRYVNTIILGVFILVWINDTFAYIVGSTLGKNKMLPRISPNKTWEGFFGGMIFTLIGGYFLSKYFNNINVTDGLVIAGIVSIFGVLGDLIESMFKRQAGVKDSGNLIPGHGGILDRMDSVIFAAPFIFLYLMLIS